MACTRPMAAWYSREVNPSGKRSIVFKPTEGYANMQLTLPCGQCISCRLEHSRQWAVRCMHEAQMHEENSFLTLTYSPEHLPEHGTLVKAHMQDFMKALRHHLSPKKVRVFYCGEYGEKKSRPHYHALLFGHDFDDKEFWKCSGDFRLYTSQTLQNLWGKGFCSIGDVTFESAAYVARYVTKKVNGKQKANGHYDKVISEYGEIFQMQPEFAEPSRNPGVGKPWFDAFQKDVYPRDEVIMRGRQMRPPKYYDRLLEKHDPAGMAEIRLKRRIHAEERAEKEPDRRLRVKEEVAMLRFRKLQRNFEGEI